jgi:hypothetical protein
MANYMSLSEPNHNILEPHGLIDEVIANHTIFSWFESIITINIDLAHKLLFNVDKASNCSSSLEIWSVDESHIFLILQMKFKLILPRDISVKIIDNFVIFYYFAVSHVLDLGFIYLTQFLEWSQWFLTFSQLICSRLEPLEVFFTDSLSLLAFISLLLVVCTIDLHAVFFNCLQFDRVPLYEAAGHEDIVVLHLEKVAAGLSREKRLDYLLFLSWI